MKALAISAWLWFGTVGVWAQEPVGEEVIGTARIAGREIPIKIPVASTPQASGPAVELDGWKYPLLANFRIGRRYQIDGSWGDLKRQYLAAQERLSAGKPYDWRVKIFVLTQVSLLEKGRDGIFRTRRSSIEPKALNDLYEGLALFKAMAEGAAEGLVKVSIDVTLDEDFERQWVTPNQPVFGDAYIRKTFGPRINGVEFEADDKVNRGPFDSVFFVHSGMTVPSPLSVIAETPVSGILYMPMGRFSAKQALPMRMMDAWRSHLGLGAQLAGFAVEAASKPWISPGMAGQVGCRTITPDSQWEVRHYRPSVPVSLPWLAIRDNPYLKLPKLSEKDLGQWAGSSLTVGDAQIQLFPGPSQRQLLLVRSDVADLFGQKLPESYGLKTIGFFSDAKRTLIAFDTGRFPAGDDLPTIFGIDGSTALPESEPKIVEPNSFGFFSAIPISGDKGPGFEVTETGIARHGGVRLDSSPVNPAETPIIEFWAKTTGLDPYSVRLNRPDGPGFVLGVPLPIPVEFENPLVPNDPVAFINDGTWQLVKLDLRTLAGSIGPAAINELWLTTPVNSQFYERQSFGPVTVTIAGLRARAATSADVPEVFMDLRRTPDEAAAVRLSQVKEPLSAESKAELLAMLDSKSETVRLNAVARLTEIKLPEAEASLILRLRGGSPFVAWVSARALQFQDTESAWSALKQTVETGPFEFNRAFAAEVLAKRPDPKNLASFALLLTSKSWRARALGAEATAAINTPEAGTFLITFLQELDPSVRYAVASRANSNNDRVVKALLYGAVNDGSERVRAACLQALIRATNPEIRKEGLKGVRDESKFARIELLQTMVIEPKEEFRDAVRLAVTDSFAQVRALALQVFKALPNKVELAEIQNTLTDSDPRVQRALIELAKAKSLSLPAETVATLRKSVDPEVAQMAEELKR